MSRIIVDERFCKGCGLCIDACPRDLIVLDAEKITEKGYHPAMLADEPACTACANCALMCPDVAITVEKGD